MRETFSSRTMKGRDSLGDLGMDRKIIFLSLCLTNYTLHHENLCGTQCMGPRMGRYY
jgi:hypothetical protein